MNAAAHTLCAAGVALMAALPGCTDPSAPSQPPVSLKQMEQPLIEANRHLTALERQDIASYLVRRGWQMDSTGTGLRYAIYEPGTGRQAQQGMVARIYYTLSLLNGTVCYTSKERGPMEFLIGHGRVESGLEEAVLLMREGDRGRFVLPSHLAHGLPGDAGCIPKKATVVYDVRLLALMTREDAPSLH